MKAEGLHGVAAHAERIGGVGAEIARRRDRRPLPVPDACADRLDADHVMPPNTEKSISVFGIPVSGVSLQGASTAKGEEWADQDAGSEGSGPGQW